MIDKTQAMDRLIAQDADLIDPPAMTDVETTEHEAIVKNCISCGKDGHHWNECRDVTIHDRLHAAFNVTPILGWESDHLKGLHNDQ
jgi:hypothetical protein